MQVYCHLMKGLLGGAEQGSCRGGFDFALQAMLWCWAHLLSVSAISIGVTMAFVGHLVGSLVGHDLGLWVGGVTPRFVDGWAGPHSECDSFMFFDYHGHVV
jgi:hypothetical protein